MTKSILIHSHRLTTKSPLKVTRVPHVENVAPSQRQQRTNWADACEVFRTDPALRKLGCSDAPASPLSPFSLARLTAARPGQPCVTPNPEGFNLPFARETAKSLSKADFFSRMHFQLSTGCFHWNDRGHLKLNGSKNWAPYLSTLAPLSTFASSCLQLLLVTSLSILKPS